MKTIQLTEEEFNILEQFILCDAEDMRDMSEAIEEGYDEEELSEEEEEARDEASDKAYETGDYNLIQGDSLEAQAAKAHILKGELAKRFKNS